MRTSRSTGWALLAGIAGIVACGAAGDGEDPLASEDDLNKVAPSADEAKACPGAAVKKDGNGDSIVSCTKPFDTAPLVRLPADTAAGGKVTFYGALTVPDDASGSFVIWTRDGSRYVAVDAKGEPVAYGDGATKLPKGLHAPTNRSTFTLYQFVGTPGAAITSPYGSAKKLTLTGARPVVEIDGCAFDSRLLGTWDGTVSKRLDAPIGGGPFARAFDENTRLPIHITLSAAKKQNPLAEYRGGAKIADATTYLLSGKIDNFDKDVTVDGKTYPSLAALGKNNPFHGATKGDVELYRLGNMHGQTNDGHWVFTYPSGSETLTLNGMSYTLTALTAASFLFGAGVKADAIDQVEIRPHIPFTVNGHTVLMAPLKIGAQTGQCH